MIKRLLLIIITFSLISCWDTEEQSALQEAWEIMDDYVENMDTSVQSARDVQELMNQNQDKLKDNLKDLY